MVIRNKKSISGKFRFPVSVLFFVLFSFIVRSSSYRSASSGKWNDYSTWEVFNGREWIPSFSFPDFSDDEILISCGTAVDLSQNVNADQMVIQEGAQLRICKGNTLSLRNGMGTDLSVNGLLYVNGTLNECDSADMQVSGLVMFNPGGANTFSDGAALAVVNTGRVCYGVENDMNKASRAQFANKPGKKYFSARVLSGISWNKFIYSTASNSVSDIPDIAASSIDTDDLKKIDRNPGEVNENAAKSGEQVSGDLRIISFIENPFTKNLELTFDVPENGNVDLAFINSAGKRILFNKVTASGGTNWYEVFQTSGKGKISFVTLSTEGKVVVEKINKGL